MSRAEPVYLEARGEPVFALHNSANPASTAVLICSPWGWDEVASYRPRRRWAEALAAAGHPVLRFDLPGCGDSAGTPADGELMERWLESIAVAGEWLRARAGAPRLALLGLGLGGLLAQEAIARGLEAEELVCWGAPASGRHFTREAKAFAGMQEGRPIEKRRDDSELPQGWLEAGGFVLSAATLAELKSLKPALTPTTAPRRALVLGRDGIADDASRERLEAAGAEVATGPGEGWGTFVGHPETTLLPDPVETAVSEWLAAAAVDDAASSEPTPVAALSGSTPTAAEPAAASASANFAAGESGFAEEPLWIPAGFGDAFGVLARPTAGATADLGVVFLNAGAIRHIGPNRLWTETARRYAAAGVPSVRVDLESIGEADGDESRRSTVSAFYSLSFERQVVAVLDHLEQTGVARRFLLVGLCAGAYWSFRTLLDDERVLAASLVNSGALVWHPGILDEREGRRFDRAFQARWWGRLLRGEIRLANLLGFGRLIGVKLGLLARRLLGRGAGGEGTIAEDLGRLRPAQRLLLAFSDVEPLQVELEALGILDRLGEWPGVALESLPGSDHTLRSVAAQGAVSALLDAELERAVAAAKAG